MKKFFAEFKAFIKKGNVVDLAVAVVIGSAFNKIVNSLVNNIIMPLISLMIGGTNVSDWKWIIRKAEYDSAGVLITAETALQYGIFIQALIDFLIIALTIFLMVKIFNASKKRFVVFGEKIIAETKELTKKQLKSLKKISKNLKKGKIDEQTAEQLVNAEQLPVNKDTVETTNDNNPQINQNGEEVETNSTNNTTSQDANKPETKTLENSNTTTTEQNINQELLKILTEIRDCIKK